MSVELDDEFDGWRVSGFLTNNGYFYKPPEGILQGRKIVWINDPSDTELRANDLFFAKQEELTKSLEPWQTEEAAHSISNHEIQYPLPIQELFEALALEAAERGLSDGMFIMSGTWTLDPDNRIMIATPYGQFQVEQCKFWKKLKKFWKEHKTEILITAGVIVVAGGIAIIYAGATAAGGAVAAAGGATLEESINGGNNSSYPTQQKPSSLPPPPQPNPPSSNNNSQLPDIPTAPPSSISQNILPLPSDTKRGPASLFPSTPPVSNPLPPLFPSSQSFTLPNSSPPPTLNNHNISLSPQLFPSLAPTNNIFPRSQNNLYTNQFQNPISPSEFPMPTGLPPLPPSIPIGSPIHFGGASENPFSSAKSEAKSIPLIPASPENISNAPPTSVHPSLVRDIQISANPFSRDIDALKKPQYHFTVGEPRKPLDERIVEKLRSSDVWQALEHPSFRFTKGEPKRPLRERIMETCREWTWWQKLEHPSFRFTEGEPRKPLGERFTATIRESSVWQTLQNPNFGFLDLPPSTVGSLQKEMEASYQPMQNNEFARPRHFSMGEPREPLWDRLTNACEGTAVWQTLTRPPFRFTKEAPQKPLQNSSFLDAITNPSFRFTQGDPKEALWDRLVTSRQEWGWWNALSKPKFHFTEGEPRQTIWERIEEKCREMDARSAELAHTYPTDSYLCGWLPPAIEKGPDGKTHFKGHQVLSQRLPTLGTPNPDIFMSGLNGLNTTLQSALSHQAYLSSLCNQPIDFIYNHSNGIFFDLLEVFFLNYPGKSPNVENHLHKAWQEFADQHKDNPNKKILQICHSQGAIHVYNALASAPQELRDRIIVVAIAPALIVPERLCHKSFNYASSSDIVYYGGLVYANILDMLAPIGASWERTQMTYKDYEELIILEPHPGAEGMDHDFQSPTFADPLTKIVTDYINKNGEYQ